MKFLRGKNTIFGVGVPLLAALLWAVPSTSQASIQLPEQSPFDLEQMIAEADSGSSSTGTSQERQDAFPEDVPNEEPNEPNQLDYLQAYTSTSTGGSTSGTSTSSSGSGGNNVSPLASILTANLSDAELVAWVAGEQRFSLPTPPGNELLRPPRLKSLFC